MKLIDYGICFGFVVICFVCVWSYNGKLIVTHSMTNMQVNNTMDEIVRDSLEKTIMEMYEKYGEFDYINKLPEYKEKLMDNLKKEMEFVMLGTFSDDGKRLMEARIDCGFLVWGNYMYVYKNGTFSEIILSDESEVKRYLDIISIMEKECGHSLNLPKEDYDKNNKIGEYSFSVVYSTYRGNRAGSPYIIRSFSSAKLQV